MESFHETAQKMLAAFRLSEPILAQCVVDAAKYAPTGTADDAISASRLFLGAMDCGDGAPEAHPLRRLFDAVGRVENGQSAVEQLRQLFRVERGPDIMPRLEAGLSVNAEAIFRNALERGNGQTTAASFVDALLSPSDALLWKRLNEYGLDRKVLRRLYFDGESFRDHALGDLPELESFRRHGIAYYQHFYRAIHTENLNRWFVERGIDDVRAEEFRDSLRDLPLPAESLPLRILLSLAQEVRSGSLEWLYGIGLGLTDSELPASEPFRGWLSSAESTYRDLFPEILRGDVRGIWKHWVPPTTTSETEEGRLSWDELEQSLNEFYSTRAKTPRFGSAAQWILYVYFRDGARDLWPLLAQFDPNALDLAIQRLMKELSKASSNDASSGIPFLLLTSMDRLRERERQLAGELPTSAWTIFALLLQDYPDDLRSLLGERFEDVDAEAVLERIRIHRRRQTTSQETLDQTRPETRATRDYWTFEDELGYRPFAEAITSFIRHRETLPPLTIGIKAPWGAGKTSLMRMVQHDLDPRKDVAIWQPREIKLDEKQRLKLIDMDSERIESRAPEISRLSRLLAWSRSGQENSSAATVRDLLDRSERPPAKDSTIDQHLKALKPGVAEVTEESKWRPTVWFNPWMYQTGEQTWAGLAGEIIGQISDRLDPIDREWFWLQLNLRRVDREAVRRRVYSALFQRLLPAIVTSAIVLVLAGMSLLAGIFLRQDWLTMAASGVLPLSPLVLAGFGFVQRLKFLGQRVAASFPDLVNGPKIADGLGEMLRSESKGLADAVTDPGYGAKMGFLYLVQSDMKRVLDLVATPKQPLVVFVDDLDRCAPGTVAQVIEAVNLFLAGEFPNCIFVLAMEPDIVAAHVEVANEKLVEHLGRGMLAEEWTTLGWRFLDKIVQLPLSLPEIDGQDALDPFLDRILGDGRPAATSPQPPIAATNTAAHRGTRRKQQTVAPSHTDGPAIAAGDVDREIVRRIVAAAKAKAHGATIAGIRTAATEAAAEVGAEAHAGTYPREAAAASREIFESLLSEQNPNVRAAIEGGIDLLGPRNPRQVKRFLNLFRFYAFVEAVRSFNAGPDDVVAELRDIGKVAALAIRWPSLVTVMTRKFDGRDGLEALEVAARVSDEDWAKALRSTGLLGKDNEAAVARRYQDLRQILRSDPKVSDLGARLL